MSNPSRAKSQGPIIGSRPHCCLQHFVHAQSTTTTERNSKHKRPVLSASSSGKSPSLSFFIMDETQTRPELSQEEQVPANPPSRKRQLDSDNDNAEPQTKRARTTRPISEPARLTRQNLARFNKMGKKKSSDPSDDSRSTKTKTTSTTSTGFADKARKNGILDPHGSRLANNLKDIRQQQAKSRATASPARVGIQ